MYPVIRRGHVREKPRPLAENARRAGHPVVCVMKAWASPQKLEKVPSVPEFSY